MHWRRAGLCCAAACCRSAASLTSPHRVLSLPPVAALPAGFPIDIDMVSLLVNLIISVMVPSIIGKVGAAGGRVGQVGGAGVGRAQDQPSH